MDFFFPPINRSRAKNFFFWTLSWIIYFSSWKPKHFVHCGGSVKWFFVCLSKTLRSRRVKKKKCVYDTSYIIFVQRRRGISPSINQFQRTPIRLDIAITFNRNARVFTSRPFQYDNQCNYYYYLTFIARPSHQYIFRQFHWRLKKSNFVSTSAKRARQQGE